MLAYFENIWLPKGPLEPRVSAALRLRNTGEGRVGMNDSW